MTGEPTPGAAPGGGSEGQDPVARLKSLLAGVKARVREALTDAREAAQEKQARMREEFERRAGRRQ